MTNSKRTTILFWAFTAPVLAMMIMSAAAMLMQQPQNVEGFVHLGYPLYFMTFLGIAKALGSAALIYRRFSTLTEWAYAGFTFDFLGASYSHYASGDGLGPTMGPLVVLALLAGSYWHGKKL
jgi:hypothetical protein